MSKLKEYISFEEKEPFFEGETVIINTKDQFDRYWNIILGYNLTEFYLFRGISESRYKLYNSCQRYWIEKELSKQKLYYNDFVRGLIKKSQVWNKKSLIKYLGLFNIYPDNSISYLSFMQHHGIPTPILDFSQSALVALYFAVRDIEYGNSSDNEIDNYCSLYILDKSRPYFSLTTEKFEKLLIEKEIYKYENLPLEYSIISLPMKNEYLKLINNFFIINQKGAFVYSNSENLPLEEYYIYDIKFIKELITNEAFQELNYHDTIGSCWNIHKSLKPYILSKLKQEGITKDYIYPNNDNLRNFALRSTLEEI